MYAVCECTQTSKFTYKKCDIFYLTPRNPKLQRKCRVKPRKEKRILYNNVKYFSISL